MPRLGLGLGLDKVPIGGEPTGPFDFSTIPDLELWLEGRRLAEEGWLDGEEVNQWIDLLGGSYFGAANGDGAEFCPLYRPNAFNTQSGLEFDGVDDIMYHSVTNAAANYTCMMVVKSSGAGYGGLAYHGLFATAGTGFMMLSRVGVGGPWGTYDNIGEAPSAGGALDNASHLLVMIDNGPSGGSFYTDGSGDGGWVGAAAGQSLPHLGGLAGQSSKCTIGAVLVWTRALDETERGTAMGALISTYL